MYNSLLRGGFWPVYKEWGKDQQTSLCWSSYADSPGFRYLFDKYSSTLNEFSKVPPQLIHSLVKQLTTPFMAEFVEMSDNELFLEVSADFFQYLFWDNTLYVSYENFFDLYENTISEDPEQEIDLNDYDIPEEEAFQLWYRSGKDSEDGIPKFTHLKTGLVFSRPDWREAMIPASWDGLLNTRFIDWYSLAYRMVLEQQAICLLSNLCTKRMEVTNINSTQEALKSVVNSIYNGSPFLGVDLVNDASARFFIQPVELRDFQLTIHLGWDRALAELGRVANTNPKTERLTTGENYKDIVSVANRQRLTLNQLKLFAAKVKKRWGIELSFALNGIPQRAPMEGDIETAGMQMSDIGHA